MRLMISTGERPAFPLVCLVCHGLFFHKGLVLSRTIAATIARPWAALTCGHGTSWEDAWRHPLGMSRMFAHDTPVGQLILLARVSLPYNKDAVVVAVAPFGPYGARSNNETATRLTTRMSETSVFIKWGRRDLDTPHLTPWQRQWVVNTLSRT